MMSSEGKEAESHSDSHHSSLIDSRNGYGTPEPEPKPMNRESVIPNSWRKEQKIPSVFIARAVTAEVKGAELKHPALHLISRRS